MWSYQANFTISLQLKLNSLKLSKGLLQYNPDFSNALTATNILVAKGWVSKGL